MTIKETATQIIRQLQASAAPLSQSAEIIEAALLAERESTQKYMHEVLKIAVKAEAERCARIVEHYDFTAWVKNGGRLRDMLAVAIRTEE